MVSKKKNVVKLSLSEAASIMGRMGGGKNTPAQMEARKMSGRRKGFHYDLCEAKPPKPLRWSASMCKKEIMAIQDAPVREIYLIPDDVALDPAAYMDTSFPGRLDGKTVRLRVVSVKGMLIKVRRAWSYEQ